MFYPSKKAFLAQAREKFQDLTTSHLLLIDVGQKTGNVARSMRQFVAERNRSLVRYVPTNDNTEHPLVGPEELHLTGAVPELAKTKIKGNLHIRYQAPAPP